MKSVSRITSIHLIICLILGLVLSMAITDSANAAGTEKLKRFKTKKELCTYVKNVKKEEEKRQKEWQKKYKPVNIPDDDLVIGVPKTEKAAATSHTETYTQVKGVDESDIIKTDGKYIYTVSSDYDDIDIITIYRANKGKAKKISTIKFRDWKKYYRYISEIYIKKNRMVVVGEAYKRSRLKKDNWSSNCLTTLSIYSIKNKKKPKRLHTYAQSGYPVATRMIGDNCYVVSDDYIRTWNGYYIPCIRKKGKMSQLKATSVCAFPETMSTNYAVVGKVNIKNATRKTLKHKCRAILGASADIFCSTKNLYIASSTRGYYMDTLDWNMDESLGFTGNTSFLKIGIGENNLTIKAKGMVPGAINNQFSMDEHNGFFRVATTGMKNGKDINYLFVLNENMKIVGETEPFAEDEHIESVRFLGNKGYIITYKETDPLFVVDLKNPTAPRITGSVKITGFSTLLHPVGSDKLLGVGYSTKDGEDMEIQNGVKLALFSVKNMSSPSVLDSKSFLNIDSTVQEDHRGFMVNNKKKYYAVPYEDEDYNGGVICFKIEGNKIKVVKRWKCNREIIRCIAIGDYVYAMGYDGRVKSFKL